MPEEQTPDELTAVRDLLREGRTTEADRLLDTIQKRIRDEIEQRKRDLPPPGPKSLAQLEHEWKQVATDLLGNNPRLAHLLVEIEGKHERPE